MPQLFHVIQCYNCETFQVHQVKKDRKWTCKLCGEKQSLKKVFGQGSGKECRDHVQKLNTKRGELAHLKSCLNVDRENTKEGRHVQPEISQEQGFSLPEKNRWNAFVEPADLPAASDDIEDDMYTTDASVFKQGRKRKRETRDKTSANRPAFITSSPLDDVEDSYTSFNYDNVRRTSNTSRSTSDLLDCAEKRSQSRHLKNTVSVETTYSEHQSHGFLRAEDQGKDSDSCSYMYNGEVDSDDHISGQTFCRINKQAKFSPSGNKSRGSHNVRPGPQQKGNKWDVFQDDNEKDESEISQESDCDTRPYITFDPSDYRDNCSVLTSSVHSTLTNGADSYGFFDLSEMVTETENSKKEVTDAGTKVLGKSHGTGAENRRRTGPHSKWFSFTKTGNHSVDGGVAEDMPANDNHFVGKACSKWEGFVTKTSSDSEVTESDDIKSCIASKENKRTEIVADKNEGGKQARNQVSGASVRFGTSQQDVSNNVMSLFTVGDVDDEDFEL